MKKKLKNAHDNTLCTNFARKLKILPEIKITEDGSHTLYVPELNEHYHSIHGALQESLYIFIGCGLRFSREEAVNILEVGFGTGLNALLTAIDSTSVTRKIQYTTLEKYPLAADLLSKLNYSGFTGPEGSIVFKKIHDAEWNTRVIISNNFILEKIKMDLVTDPVNGKYNLIYFDAFGPDKQPELWRRQVFEKIAEVTASGGILTTYSAKGEVKRNLIACGFEVSMLPGPPGKRQIIRAIKI